MGKKLKKYFGNMNFNRTRKQPERMNRSEDEHLEHIGSRLLDEDPREGKS